LRDINLIFIINSRILLSVFSFQNWQRLNPNPDALVELGFVVTRFGCVRIVLLLQVDLLFGLSHGWEPEWAEQGLPEGLHDLLVNIGEALHDAVTAPEIAENFGCLPEQLLERVEFPARLLKTDLTR
jgi:hypothetical protein